MAESAAPKRPAQLKGRRLPEQRPYDLLIFDWDGTLIDSIGSIVGCTRRALEDLGLAPVDDEIIRAGIGLGLREAVENLAPGCDDATFERICEAYREHWFETFSHAHCLFPATRETLEGLRRNGYRMAVATAKGRQGLDQDLASSGIGELFEATRTVSESPAKPDPGMVLDLLEETFCEAPRALVVGDTVHDVEMARAAGVSAVGVSSGTTRCPELEAAGALVCLGGVGELPGWLEGQRRAGAEGSEATQDSNPPGTR